MSNFVLDGLLPSDDLPHRLAETPHWSENYLSVAAFPDAGAGHWLHLGRTPWDPHLWQEMFCFALPEDRYLVSRATACTSDVDGPQGAGLSYSCEEPFRRWTKTLRGGARLMTGQELRAGPMTEGPLVLGPADGGASIRRASQVAALTRAAASTKAAVATPS
jgi:hypothetical protein